jgi:hypothetical protein
MTRGAFVSWREECEAIHKAMDCLFAAGWLETAEERRVRKVQYMALIDRRNVAAAKLLGLEANRSTVPMAQQKRREIVEAPRPSPKAEPAFDATIPNAKASEQPSEKALPVGRTPKAQSTDPALEIKTFLMSWVRPLRF